MKYDLICLALLLVCFFKKKQEKTAVKLSLFNE